MEAKANLKYLRISPRKVKIVLDLIRGKDVATATSILLQTPKAASEPVLKLLKSAAANAEHKANRAQDHNKGIEEIDSGKGCDSGIIGDKKAVHHAVNGDEDHHDNGGQGEAQQLAVMKMV